MAGSGSFRPRLASKPTPTRRVILGDTSIHEYKLADKLSADSWVEWEQTVSDHEGRIFVSANDRSLSVNFRALTPGERTIETYAHHHFGPDRQFKTSVHLATEIITTTRPDLEVLNMSSVTNPAANGTEFSSRDANSRGRIPVLDHFQIKEDLLVKMAFHPVGEALANFEILPQFTGPLTIISVSKEGDGDFVLRMRPRHLGTAAGQLSLHVFGKQYFLAKPISLDVREMATIDDFKGDKDGIGRPSSPDDAISHFHDAWVRLALARRNAIDTLLLQSTDKDPPPTTQLWKTIAKELFSVALGAVTAGIGASVVSHWSHTDYVGKLGRWSVDSDGRKEFFKVFTEQSIQGVLKSGYDGAIDDHASSPTLGLRARFAKAQYSALTDESMDKASSQTTSATSRLRRLEARDPLSGMRDLMAAAEAIRKTQTEAVDLQTSASTMAYMRLMAADDIGHIYNTNGRPDPKNDDVSSVSHSYMHDKMWAQTYDLNANYADVGIRGLLLLSLDDDDNTAKSDAPNTRRPPMRIKSAKINGANRGLRQIVARTPIRDMKIPIYAVYENGKTSWLAARSGSGAYAATQDSSRALEKRAGTSDANDAARVIIEGLGKCPEPGGDDA